MREERVLFCGGQQNNKAPSRMPGWENRWENREERGVIDKESGTLKYKVAG